MKEFTYTIQDELGLHARPAGLLVKKAGAYQSKIEISKGETIVAAKRLFAIMGLAVKQGDTIKVTLDGEDEETAFVEMKAFCEENF